MMLQGSNHFEKKRIVENKKERERKKDREKRKREMGERR